MFLLIGLGNPGRRYAKNRHNIGYMVLDAIVQQHGFSAYREKFSAALAEGIINGQKILALKPTTYMNRSGQAVGAAMGFYKLSPQAVMVIHDDLDLAYGLLRIKRGGGHAGHNGLRDIDAHIGRDYLRLRIGIGHPGDKEAVNPHVLGDFTRSERTSLEPMIEAIAHHFPLLIGGDQSLFMTRLAASRPDAAATNKDQG